MARAAGECVRLEAISTRIDFAGRKNVPGIVREREIAALAGENELLVRTITREITFYQVLFPFTPRFLRSRFLRSVSIIRESRSSRLRDSRSARALASFIPPPGFGVISPLPGRWKLSRRSTRRSLPLFGRPEPDGMRASPFPARNGKGGTTRPDGTRRDGTRRPRGRGRGSKDAASMKNWG